MVPTYFSLCNWRENIKPIDARASQNRRQAQQINYYLLLALEFNYKHQIMQFLTCGWKVSKRLCSVSLTHSVDT